ncbi:MAG TPA: RNA polymerase Rpb4 family protein [Methanoregulaceae archaeon]|nr:MAG: RNA polymerase Rpb4 family protein [Methanolinea sp.]HON81897.1 RNA polymerase Rpb4 family protein [Methanoregulaceae archaeon]HPD10705.1 RNA polymerase Rpb4 family protein [Methanoregulaceae archaeon]HRT15834.1 RNA polymerase Rpb4 family protein [Methanoregulaceae archaeon]HRU31348.1 RNA polymerase Rpb4 family protein [Methanoregulaceae archaeon]
MKVKAIRSEEKVTLSEVRKILAEVEAERLAAGKEMSYELRRSIEHANTLAKMPPEDSRVLVDELQKLEKMKPDIAFRIANIAPRTRDELRAVYAKEKFSLTGEELDRILELVASHL